VVAIAQPDPRFLTGVSSPRLAPPTPAVSLIDDFITAGKDLSIDLMPWQAIAGRYLAAVNGERWRYPEVCIVVARQNGKTSLLLPHILQRLRMGRKILHTAQNRELPRQTFLTIAGVLAGSDFISEIRQANGQETIKTINGGRYTLVAPRPGVRGHSVDDVILDEVREQHNFELIAAIKPTQTASRNRQIIYMSNAGDSDSVVLNDLKRRGENGDERLAYLEWSAAPERALSDREGWAEANPALGITIQLDTLEDFYANLKDAQPSLWETEHLCRWVISMQPRLLADSSWQQARGVLEEPVRPVMGVSMDPSGSRASAVLAWLQTDGSVGLRVDADVTGEPIDVDKLGPDLNERALRAGVLEVLYDPWTDANLARHFRKSRAVNGREYANASAAFVRAVESKRVHWDNADQISEDLAWTARKPHENGSWMAVPAKEDRPITAALAAIRAVGVASGLQPGIPRVL
jgi:hypothetical protein